MMSEFDNIDKNMLEDIADNEIRIVGEAKYEPEESVADGSSAVFDEEESAFGTYAAFDCYTIEEAAPSPEPAESESIHFVGSVAEDTSSAPKTHKKWIAIAVFAIVLALLALVLFIPKSAPTENDALVYATQDVEAAVGAGNMDEPISPLSAVDSVVETGFVEIRDTVINDVELRLYIPHNAEMSLMMGKIDKNDPSIIYYSQAADERADNGKINGQFVLKGELLSRGRAQKGFCASINGVVTIGVASDTVFFEEAIENNGDFFRQYPLVKDGKIVENNPKNKSIRRGICDRHGEIFMVETLTRESFHDFSQALADLGVRQAVNLRGGTGIDGMAVDQAGVRHEFAASKKAPDRMSKNTSYVVWRRKAETSQGMK